MHDRTVALWITAIVFLIYCGTAKGVLEEVDDAAMLRVTQSIVHNGTTAVPPDTPGAMPGVDGRSYVRYGLGQSLLAIPFYAIGSLLPSEVPTDHIYDPHGFVVANRVATVVTGLNILNTSAAVGLTFLTCRELGFRLSGSVAAAAALGIGTFAWHYARTFMSEPTSMLAVVLAFYAILRFARTGCNRWLVLSGAAGGLALLTRIANAILLPVLGMWLVWLLWRTDTQRDTRGPAAALLSRRPGREFSHWVSAIAAWLIPIALTVLFLGYYNALRFGSVLETGYGDQAQAFTTPLYVGLYGLLLSSGKGVFFYAPVLVAGVIGWNALRRNCPSGVAVLVGLIATYLVFYARYDWWYGGGPWGPRFLVVILPLACLGIAALHDTAVGLTRHLALYGLMALSVGVQVLSIVVPYLPYDAQMEQDPAAFDQLLWNPAFSPIVENLRSTLHGAYPPDLAFTYYPSNWLLWAQVFAILLAVSLFAFGVRRICWSSS